MLGFGDQIADGEEKVVLADEDRVAFALGAEIGRAERVFRRLRAKLHDRAQHVGQLESVIRRVGPRGASDIGIDQVRQRQRLVAVCVLDSAHDRMGW